MAKKRQKRRNRMAHLSLAERKKVIHMAKKRNASADAKQLVHIEIVRHMPGPPRRAPGQHLLMTRRQIEEQGLVQRTDYKVVAVTGGP